MIGTLFFVLFFLLVLAWVGPGGKARFDAAAQLPLDEARSTASHTAFPTEPSDD